MHISDSRHFTHIWKGYGWLSCSTVLNNTLKPKHFEHLNKKVIFNFNVRKPL